MTRICPKCSYVRKASDEAPEWQCPSCQVAYIKASGEPAATNYGRYGTPAAKSRNKSSGLLKWAVVLAMLGAALLLGKPLWSGKQAPPAVVSSVQPEVTLYATEWCGYCAAARKLFEDKGIAYTELDVEKTSAGYEGHKKLGGNGVPLIVIGDEVIRGFDERALQKSLKPWFKES
nr:glutaredoxin domain-containing protein [Janthinobacterium sp. Marseille]